MITEKCPTGCGRMVEAGKVMCGSCWSRVPKPIQRKVYSTWRALRNGAKDEGPTLRYDYETAREAAVEAIR